MGERLFRLTISVRKSVEYTAKLIILSYISPAMEDGVSHLIRHQDDQERRVIPASGNKRIRRDLREGDEKNWGLERRVSRARETDFFLDYLRQGERFPPRRYITPLLIIAPLR